MIKLARTNAKGRKNFKRVDHKHGHCYICGYDKRDKGRKKTKDRDIIKLGDCD